MKVLQRRLGVIQTGWYGPITLRKVKSFQASRGLRAAGYVGPPHVACASEQKRRRGREGIPVHAADCGDAGPIRVPRPARGSLKAGVFLARGRPHQGMDMPGRRGSAIVAIENATVLRAGRQSNGALRIVLQGSSGSKFYYGHMDKNLVQPGQRVTRGQKIGVMGDSGSPGAVHLHFEYWRSGGESAAVDPEPLVRSLC